MRAASGALSALAWLAATAPPDANSSSVTIALYGMFGLLGSTLFVAVANVVTTRMRASRGHHHGMTTATTLLRAEHELWLRWMTWNHFDPRRIRSGYESIEEVLVDDLGA